MTNELRAILYVQRLKRMFEWVFRTLWLRRWLSNPWLPGRVLHLADTKGTSSCSLSLISDSVTAELDWNVPNHQIGHLFLRVEDKNQSSTGILHIQVSWEKKENKVAREISSQISQECIHFLAPALRQIRGIWKKKKAKKKSDCYGLGGRIVIV